MTQDQLTALRAAVAALRDPNLTPGPWETSYHKPDDPQPCLVSGERCVLYAPYFIGGSDEQAKADLTFAAASRTGLEAALAAIGEYGRHTLECNTIAGRSRCICGFADLAAILEEETR